MVARLTRLILLALTLFSLQAQAGLFDNGSSPHFVTVNQAFGFDFSQNNNKVLLSWKVKSGYYLYRQQISITGSNADIAGIAMPPDSLMKMNSSAKVRFSLRIYRSLLR